MKLGWIASITITLCLMGLIAGKWNQIHTSYVPYTDQLTSSRVINTFLETRLPQDLQDSSQILVGLFVEALNFVTPNDVAVSGYIWQVVPAMESWDIKTGIIFPDAVGEVTLDYAYEEQRRGRKVMGWAFEAVLRQPFIYRDYPLDHKTVWVRLWPKEFNRPVLLVPDLDSYTSTRETDSFGISRNIVLKGWDINESFFNYKFAKYDTNFGLSRASVKNRLPELHFNIVLNRKLFNAFFINITLLIVSMTLLYSLVIMITSDMDKKSEFEISVGGAVGTCSGLFFAVLLAHIHLRESFPGSGVAYMEYFYLISYIFILGSAALIYLFYKDGKPNENGILCKDAICFKLAFWPGYFGTIYGATLVHFGV